MPPQRQHILVITPDVDMRAFIERALRPAAYRVETIAHSSDAPARLDAVTPNLVLLDVALLPRDRSDLTDAMRARGTAPLILFTSSPQAEAAAAALNMGADDFLTTPFSAEELRARVQRVLQRRGRYDRSPQPARLQVGALTIDLEAQTVQRNGQPVVLSRTDWALLEMLVRHAGHVLPYRTLLQQVWGDAYTTEIGYLRTYIKRLRDALEDDPQHPQYVQTEARLGYRFVIPHMTAGEQHTDMLPATAAQRSPRLHNLSPPLTSFVGREDELAALETLLGRADVRLLTLTGPGGVGKTRLALQAGAHVAGAFRDGARFVDLSHMRHADMLATAIAHALNIKERGDETSAAQLKAALSAGELLLILDNFEQVIAGAPLVAELLRAAPRLKVLVTSRAPLHLQGEHEFSVPPLALPDRAALPSLDEVTRVPVVALFLDRARAVKPEFRLTGDNVAAIAEICAALDGLPLAIELAAARIKVLPPQAMAARLGRRLALLTGGARDLPPRQQTLRDLLDWSFDLLDPAYRPLFARLAVFVGGGTLAAIETICALPDDPSGDLLAGLTALVDASLLRQSEEPSGEPRFSMLETIREYASELLEQSGELERMRRRHAAYYLSLAEAAALPLKQAHPQEWLNRLERDHANLRAALQWATDHGRADMLTRFVGALWQFWHVHSHRRDARRWVAAALTQRHDLPDPVAAQALYGAGWLAYDRREYTEAAAYFEDSLALQRAAANKPGISEVLRGLGEVALAQRQFGRARTMFEESLSLSAELGSAIGRAWSLHHLGRVALEQAAYDRATALLHESFALFQALGDQAGLAWSVHNLGRVALEQAAHDHADRRLHESVPLFRELGDKTGLAWSLLNLGRSALEQGRCAEAERRLHESLALFEELADDHGRGWAFYNLGLVARQQHDQSRARHSFDASLQFFRNLGDRWGIAQVSVQRDQLAAA